MITGEFIGEGFFIYFLVSVDLGVMPTDFVIVICRLFPASVGSLLNCKIHIFSKVTTHKHTLILADLYSPKRPAISSSIIRILPS